MKIEAVTGEDLIVARRNAGLSIKALGKVLGITVRTLKRYESDYSNPIINPDRHNSVRIVAARWAQQQLDNG